MAFRRWTMEVGTVPRAILGVEDEGEVVIFGAMEGEGTAALRWMFSMMSVMAIIKKLYLFRAEVIIPILELPKFLIFVE